MRNTNPKRRDALTRAVKWAIDKSGCSYGEVVKRLKSAGGRTISKPTLIKRLNEGGFTELDAEAIVHALGLDEHEFLDVVRFANEHPMEPILFVSRRDDLPAPRVAAGVPISGQESRSNKDAWCTVEGHSMEPVANHGDRVRVVPITFDQLAAGDLVVVSFNPRMKRDGDGLYEAFPRPDRTVRLMKRNTRFRYDEVECSIEDIAAMYRVVERGSRSVRP